MKAKTTKNLNANELIKWIQSYNNKLIKPKIKDDYEADMLEIVGTYIFHRAAIHSIECKYEFDQDPQRERKYEYIDEKAGLKIHIDREIAEDKVTCSARTPTNPYKIAVLLALDRDIITITNEHQSAIGIEENTISKIRLNEIKDVKIEEKQ